MNNSRELLEASCPEPAECGLENSLSSCPDCPLLPDWRLQKWHKSSGVGMFNKYLVAGVSGCWRNVAPPGWQLWGAPGPLLMKLSAFGGVEAFVAAPPPSGLCEVGLNRIYKTKSIICSISKLILCPRRIAVALCTECTATPPGQCLRVAAASR